jgi:hypothetical protein
MVSGDAAGARTGFFAAEDAFLRAQDQAENPLLRAAGFLPVLGRTPDAVADMAEAGALLARAGKVLAEALAGLPEGTAALAPERGAIPLQPLRKIAPGLEEARALVLEAQVVMDGSPTRALLGPVGAGQARLMVELDRAERAVTAAAAMARSLPDFLGGGGTRRYFVAAQNPAELRGTGGFIGSYAILTANQGRLRLGNFRPIETLPNVPSGRIESPTPSFAERYDAFGGAGFWRNINMTADFPSAAVAMERLYEETEGVRLDGAIAADPFLLAALLEVTGEVQVPGISAVLDSGSVVEYVTNEAYNAFTDSRTRKRVLGDVAEGVFDRFLRGGLSGGPEAAGRSLIDAAAGGHLMLHSTRPAEEKDFHEAGVDGALGGESGDYLAVAVNNAAGNKIDFYAERNIGYQVRLGAEGSGVGLATVELANTAPSSGQPAYVIGPYSKDYRAGESVSLLDVYCATSCSLASARLDGRTSGTGSGRELGHPVFPLQLDIPSGASTSVEYQWRLSRAWEGDDGSGVYRLTFRGQTTIRPTHLSLEVQAPDGMVVVSASPGMDVDGGRAAWTGPAGDLMTFEIEFQRPLIERMWRSVVRFFNRPVFHLGMVGAAVVVRRRGIV